MRIGTIGFKNWFEYGWLDSINWRLIEYPDGCLLEDTSLNADIYSQIIKQF